MCDQPRSKATLSSLLGCTIIRPLRDKRSRPFVRVPHYCMQSQFPLHRAQLCIPYCRCCAKVDLDRARRRKIGLEPSPSCMRQHAVRACLPTRETLHVGGGQSPAGSLIASNMPCMPSACAQACKRAPPHSPALRGGAPKQIAILKNMHASGCKRLRAVPLLCMQRSWF